MTVAELIAELEDNATSRNVKIVLNYGSTGEQVLDDIDVSTGTDEDNMPYVSIRVDTY